MQWGLILTRALGVEGRVIFRHAFDGWATLLFAGCAGSSPDRSAPLTLDVRVLGALHFANPGWVLGVFLPGRGIFSCVGTPNPTLTYSSRSLWAADTVRRDLTRN